MKKIIKGIIVVLAFLGFGAIECMPTWAVYVMGAVIVISVLIALYWALGEIFFNDKGEEE